MTCIMVKLVHCILLQFTKLYVTTRLWWIFVTFSTSSGNDYYQPDSIDSHQVNLPPLWSPCRLCSVRTGLPIKCLFAFHSLPRGIPTTMRSRLLCWLSNSYIHSPMNPNRCNKPLINPLKVYNQFDYVYGLISDNNRISTLMRVVRHHGFL